MWPAARRLLEYFEAVADDIGLSRPGAQIVELGAGTGWLSVALAKNLPNAERVVATEMRAGGALRWLRRNVRANERIDTLATEECDWSTYLGGEPTKSGYGDDVANDVAPATDAPRPETEKTETETETETETISAVAGDASSVTVGSLILATAVTCGVLTVATRIAPLGFGVLPTATLITVLLATATPPATSRFLKPSGDALGSCSLFVFFASAGAAGGAVSRAFAHPALFAYLFVLYVAHALVLFAVGKRILRLSTKELLVASSANVGGPATAGALAAGKNWTELVVPGMLVGNLGNAVGTFVGLGMAKAFYHLCW